MTVSGFPAPTYPTPLERLDALCHEHVDVWLKNDGLSHPVYGGNKVRKLAALAKSAAARDAKRWLTFGAAGSHHVLTTALFARAHGIACAALLTPQPRTPHAVDTLRAALGAGLEAYPVSTPLLAPIALWRAFRAGDHVIMPGASSALGAGAYADAVRELRTQLEAEGGGQADCIVLPLGTGGTTAGVWAGTALHAVDTRVLAVAILKNPLGRRVVERLARQIVSARGGDERRLRKHGLEIDEEYVGAGYGLATPASERAARIASELGLALEPTYTAKAFARLLALIERLRVAGRARPLRVVYWHTHSARSLEPLLGEAPSFEALPRELQRLFR